MTTANPVQIQLADENEYRWNGRMEFLDVYLYGLAPTDRVILTGIGRLQPGVQVNPKKCAIKADSTKPTQEPASGQATVR